MTSSSLTLTTKKPPILHTPSEEEDTEGIDADVEETTENNASAETDEEDDKDTNA